MNLHPATIVLIFALGALIIYTITLWITATIAHFNARFRHLQELLRTNGELLRRIEYKIRF